MKTLQIGFLADGDKFFCGIDVDGEFSWGKTLRINSFASSEASKYRAMYRLINDVFRKPHVTDRELTIIMPKFSEFDVQAALRIVFNDLGYEVVNFDTIELTKQQRIIDTIRKKFQDSMRNNDVKMR